MQNTGNFFGVVFSICPDKSNSSYVLVVTDLGIGGEGCRKTKTKTWVGKHVTGTAKTELHTVLVERGLSWAEIQEKWAELTGDLEGFYLSHQACSSSFVCITLSQSYFIPSLLNCLSYLYYTCILISYKCEGERVVIDIHMLSFILFLGSVN